MRLHRMFPIAVALAASSGCAMSMKATYPLGTSSAGGDGLDSLAKVMVRANIFTPPDRAVRIALRHAAKYTKEKGKPYFLLYPTLVHAALDRPDPLPRFSSVGVLFMASAYVQTLDEQRPMARTPDEALAEVEAWMKEEQTGLAKEAAERQERDSMGGAQ